MYDHIIPYHVLSCHVMSYNISHHSASHHIISYRGAPRPRRGRQDRAAGAVRGLWRGASRGRIYNNICICIIYNTWVSIYIYIYIERERYITHG